jgi:hypothetical protein
MASNIVMLFERLLAAGPIFSLRLTGTITRWLVLPFGSCEAAPRQDNCAPAEVEGIGGQPKMSFTSMSG